MKKNLFILLSLIIIPIILLIGGIFYIYNDLKKWDDIWQPIYKTEYIVSSGGKDTIFFKSIIWGITYDYRCVTISMNNNVLDGMNPDYENDYILSGYSPVLFKVVNDTVFTLSESNFREPKNKFPSRLIIIQNDTNINNIRCFKESESYKNTNYKLFD